MGESVTGKIADANVNSILASRVLEEVLKSPGSMCPYQELQKAIGMDPQGEGYRYVMTARKRFERKHDCVLDAVPNAGIKWLTAEEVAVLRWDRDTGHSRRHASRTMRRQKTLLTEQAEAALGPEGIKRRNQNLAYAGVLVALNRPKAVQRIAAAADQSSRVLPAAEAIKFFQNGHKSAGSADGDRGVVEKQHG